MVTIWYVDMLCSTIWHHQVADVYCTYKAYNHVANIICPLCVKALCGPNLDAGVVCGPNLCYVDTGVGCCVCVCAHTHPSHTHAHNHTIIIVVVSSCSTLYLHTERRLFQQSVI